jgi:two-component system CitB family sensor kinase/two-component system sensor histidine kinase DcuS
MKLAPLLHWLRRYEPRTLYGQMVVLVMVVALVQLFVSGAIFSSLIGSISEKEIGRRALDIAHSVAIMPTVVAALQHPHQDHPEVQALAEEIRALTVAEYVVVADRQGRRLSHPDPQRIGETFVGGDELAALEQGSSYTSKAVGTLGYSLRGIVPVRDGQERIIGFVAVGYLNQKIAQIVHGYQREPGTYILMMIVIALLSASAIARFVKWQTLGLEPQEISALYQERDAILQSIRAGIIAVDGQSRIRLINHAALEHTGLDDQRTIIGEPVSTVFAGSDFAPLLQAGNEINFQELTIDGQAMFFTCAPIVHQGQVTGLVASFRRKEELDRLEEELRQTREFTEMLRVQAHEYSNKLHTLSGLLQIQAYDEALDLIVQEAQSYQSLIHFLTRAVPHPMISAILLGKYNRAMELKVTFTIDPDSTMQDVPETLNQHHLVTILGNLLDNALEAALRNRRQTAEVRLFMTDIGHDLIFEIEDTGAGIAPDEQERVFIKGYSSKVNGADPQTTHGVGLYLVQQRVADLKGQVTISTGELGGALFTVMIPKQPKTESGL